jgi:hypothetical protein
MVAKESHRRPGILPLPGAIHLSDYETLTTPERPKQLVPRTDISSVLFRHPNRPNVSLIEEV